MDITSQIIIEPYHIISEPPLTIATSSVSEEYCIISFHIYLFPLKKSLPLRGAINLGPIIVSLQLSSLAIVYYISDNASYFICILVILSQQISYPHSPKIYGTGHCPT